MKSKKILRIVAIAVCLGFLTVSISGVVYATDKTVKKPNVRTFLKKPLLLINSIFNVFLAPTDGKASTGSEEKSDSKSSSKIKTTGNLKSPRVADGD
ncbi:MAG: hypothetical protein GTO16_02515 [Candidatus Aminicenantes bacterium]|nr:hypothetical protein [Candidatus Aminicenantes bacterium]